MFGFGKRKSRKDSSMVMVPKANLDLLHWQLMQLSAAHMDATGVILRRFRSLAREVPKEVIDAIGVVEGRFSQAVTTLDETIPGGCPDGWR